MDESLITMRYLLLMYRNVIAARDFVKGMQTDINHYVTKDRIKNASFRQKSHPTSKNILRRQNPLELVFEDILTFDAENPIVGSLLKDVGKIVRCWNARC